MKNIMNQLLPPREDSHDPHFWRIIYGVLLLATLILLPALSLDAGISADEGRYDNQARKVYNYYASGAQDKSALSQKGIDPQHYNSQSFDLGMVVLEKIFKPADHYQMRHFFNALSGWLAIFIASLFVARTIGYRAAVLTLLLLFISPRLLGHSYNNNKDIPITTAFAFSSYFMMAFLRDYPEKKFRNGGWIALAIASGISLRIGSIILVPYYFLFAGLHYLATTPFREIFKPEPLRKAGILLGIGFAILPLSYFLGILPWPFGLEGPVKNTAEVLKAMSSLGVSIVQIFEGRQIWSNQIPWYYSIKYMAITVPAVVFAGILLFIGFSRKIVEKENALPLFILGFSWLFPIIYAAAGIQNDYGGWRHLMFTYPYMVALAAIGFDAALRWLTRPAYRYIAGAAIALLCLHPISHIIRNHPHEYVYFNEIFGGVDKANGYYETDYYQHSIRAACKWLNEHLSEELNAGEKFVIGKNDGPVPHYFRHWKDQIKVQHTYGYYNRGKYEWDYGIFYVGYISPHQLREGLWPPAGTIHCIKVDNTPVCAIVKRPSKEDFLGHEALKTNNVDAAIHHFNNYLETDPQDDSIHGALASVHLSKGEVGKALTHAEKALEYHPESVAAMDSKGRAQLQLKQFDDAIQTFTQLSKKAPNYHLPYYFMAVAYANKGNLNATIQLGNEAIRRNPRFIPAYQLVASAHNQAGNAQAAQAYLAHAKKIQAATQR
ncbi:MAG: tetratricopeptide repeat protein [Thermodesulfobacteriota bacterium]